MSTPIAQKLTDISSFTSKLLRKNFGRGPESCQAFLNERFLIFYIQGFLSPMETILLEHSNADNIDISRSIVMNSVLAQLKGILELEFEQDILEFYHDWNYNKNTGMITVVFEEPVTSGDELMILFPERSSLILETERITAMVQKIPDMTEAYRISPKLFLVMRKGILIPLEKALIAKGFHQTLLVTKDDLEKAYCYNEGRFEEILKQPIADIFLDWNLNEDKSVMCFVLKS
ncbi:Na-translocating system protein MpsC family protein [Ammoniphilus sp. YIM 78166]|uniref:Na-translocating system protein MpsC family protein n=1 Tax=Ammoniphilus sp. YIM 78166 TaxID=1644106 RepID=UPI00106F270D|nr:Na-translocating system protein MpsC family protein [Ammoniphilus sp. YIM 78166]